MMKIKLSLHGRIPGKKTSQNIFRTKSGRPFITPKQSYKDWHQASKLQLTHQLGCSEDLRHSAIFPLERCESITVDLYYGDRRRKDNTNTADSIMDLLTDFGIIKDDCWQVTGEIHLIPHYRKDMPGCSITIIPSNEE